MKHYAYAAHLKHHVVDSATPCGVAHQVLDRTDASFAQVWVRVRPSGQRNSAASAEHYHARCKYRPGLARNTSIVRINAVGRRHKQCTI